MIILILIFQHAAYGWGDPHYHTFVGGMHYDFHANGDFTILNALSNDMMTKLFILQGRLSRFGGPRVAYHVGLAFGHPDLAFHVSIANGLSDKKIIV